VLPHFISAVLTPLAIALLSQPVALPAPAERPLAVDFSNDPVLALARTSVRGEVFRNAIAAAVERNPSTGEANANRGEAQALLEQAQATRQPSVDASITSYRIIARDFANDPLNIVERSRPEQRTDGTLTIQQLLFDFGASEERVAAAGARIRSAAADLESAADQVALQAIAAWYDVFGYRALTLLTQSFLVGQRELRAALRERVRLGASAEGDIARVEGVLAEGDVRLARYQRLLANAEARFTELTGAPPEAGLERAPVPAFDAATRDDAALAAQNRPAVRSAEAQAVAARHEAVASNRDRLPQVTGGIDAGRYGIFENEGDYDIRARIAIRQRLFGGVEPRARQFGARAEAAQARADRVRLEAEREAAVAFADVGSLERQLAALERAYIAGRQSRDVIVARFVAARGTLFDVLGAEGSYFSVATAYIEALIELDSARYVLLSRTGRLLDRLGIDPARLGNAG
jgi:adhesin transport system outer membrane protein